MSKSEVAVHFGSLSNTNTHFMLGFEGKETPKCFTVICP